MNPLARTGLALLALCAALAGAETDPALARVWARAAAGGPLRVVAVGGSITQAGEGWIAPWLRQRFPQAAVALHNAGISGTGSWYGLFRCDTDIAAARPDLVLLEFTVNDGASDTPQARWTLESLLRRILLLPGRPAVVVMEAADRKRPLDVVSAHRRLAAHYGLTFIDLHRPLVERCAAGPERWEDLFGDDVHPTPAGHALYARLIADALETGIGAAAPAALPPLPPPLVERPLLVDGRVVPLPLPGPGWRPVPTVAGWWSRFFPGAAVAHQEGAVLTIPVQGTALGLLVHLDPAAGILAWSIDGGEPHLQPCNLRRGFAVLRLADDLAPGEHLLRLVMPAGGTGGSGVAVGAVLAGGAGDGPLPAQGEWDAGRLAELRWGAVDAVRWRWAGPFGDLTADWRAPGPTAALTQPFPPEDALPGRQPPRPGQWQPLPGGALVLDLGAASRSPTRGVTYAWTVLRSPAGGRVHARINLDYYGILWLNGREILRVDRHHGNPAEDLACALDLAPGDNHLVAKVHAGSQGHLLALRLVDAGAVQAVRPEPSP
jgi:lysophospholipase L1-like esterase